MATNFDIRIIGIYGASGVGKDTLAKIIQNTTLPIKKRVGLMLSLQEIIEGKRSEILDYSRFEIVKFASGPKKIVADMLGVPIEQLEDREYKRTIIPKYGKTVLQMIIDVAQNLRFVIHEEIWSDILFNSYTDQFWLISDLRFPHEYDAIKSRGGMCVKLINNDVESTLPIDNLLEDKEFDFYFENEFHDWRTIVWGVRRFLYQYHLYHESAESLEYMDNLLKR